MAEPRDLRELLGDDVPREELERLEHVDALLRSVPPPPAEVPQSLTRAVVTTAQPASPWTRRRVAAAVGLAAALSALFFGIGTRFGGEDFEVQRTIALQATAEGRGAAGELHVSKPDDEGTIGIELEVSGLPELPKGGYYVLWLEKDGEYAGTCGTFTVGDGKAERYWDVGYPIGEFDAWKVSPYFPNQPEDVHPPALLEARIQA